MYIPLFTNFTEATKRWTKLDFYSGGKEFSISRRKHVVVNVWLPCPCHVVAPAILQSLIVPLCSLRGCCVVLAVSECNTAKCSFSAVCPPWEAFDQSRCCVCFRVSLLACSAPWLSGVLSELKPGFLQIVFSSIRRRVHDKHAPINIFWAKAGPKTWSVSNNAICLELNHDRILTF